MTQHRKPRSIESSRGRRAHSKVKTGCLTCRIRRKKCDEAKPACQRCISTGRKCDGYLDQDRFVPYQKPNPDIRRRTRGTPSACAIDDIQSSVKSKFSGPSAKLAIFPSHLEPKIEVNGPTHAVAHRANVYNDADVRRIAHRQIPHQAISRTLSSYPMDGTNGSRLSGSFDELQNFGFFCLHTSPMFSAYLGSSSWLDLVVTLGHAYPQVFYSAAACGAAHRQFNAGISFEAFAFYRQSKALSRQAISFSITNQSLNDQVYLHKTPLMVSRLLMGLHSCFDDQMNQAVAYVQEGLRSTLSRQRRLIHSNCQTYLHNLTPDSFKTLLSRLKKAAYGSATHEAASCHSDGTQTPLNIPYVFTDLQEARDYLFVQVDTVCSLLGQTKIDSRKRQRLQVEQVLRLLNWNVSYARMIQGRRTLGKMERWTHQILLATQNALHLLIYLVLFDAVSSNRLEAESVCGIGASYETLCDAGIRDLSGGDSNQLINFVRLTGQIENLLSAKEQWIPEEHILALDTAIGLPRQSVPSGISSSSKTRHLIKSRLPAALCGDALWRTLGVYSIAERFSAITEYAVVKTVSSAYHAPEYTHWSSITHAIESDKLVLRYCQPGQNPNETLWIEQIWNLGI